MPTNFSTPKLFKELAMNRVRVFLVGLVLTSLLVAVDSASAQLRTGAVTNVNRVLPSPEFFLFSMPLLQNGDFVKALEAFNNDLRRAFKVPTADGQQFLWLDSICYWTMLGETHYQMGRYDEAVQAFSHAVQIYLNNSDWLKNVTFVGAPTTKPRVPMPWGVSTRKGEIGIFSQCGFQILQESVNILNLGNRGTAISQEKQLTTIHAGEIIRCLGHAIRRRAEIQGPLAKYDPMTKDLVQILGGRPCPPNHFTGTWVDVLYGLALAAIGDDATAAPELEKGLLMNGMFDHQLTPIALMELGSIAQRAGKSDEAVNMFFEASLSCATNLDYILLEESFRSMANAQKRLDKTKPCLPCRAALAFFSNERKTSPLVVVTLQQEVAEDALTANQLPVAAELLTKAEGLMRQRTMADSRYGARNLFLGAMLSYLVAWNDYVAGKPASPAIGDKKLETALNFMRTGSLWIYQLTALDMLFQSAQISTRGPITARIADEIYEFLLRDPTDFDWVTQPMDSLAVMTFVPPSAYQRWFYLAVQRGDREKAFDISELARRAKFYSLFKLGPRLLSLRILFESSDNVSQEMLLERQSLTLDFATFGALSSKVADIKKQLLMLPIVPKNQAQADQQKNLLADLEKASAAQELMLRPIALSRTKAPNAFPPILKLEKIRSELPEKTAILVFTESQGDLYGFLVDKRNLSMWLVANDPRKPPLRKLITDFLEELGNKDANRALPLKELTDPEAKWKKAGNELLKRLLGEQRQASFTDLVIVPTGALWYVPFEAMCVPIGQELRPMIAAGDTPLTIRYAPTASLGVPVKNSRSQSADTLVAYGKLNSKDAPTAALDAVDRYTKAGIPRLIPMPSIASEPTFREFPGSASVFATQIRQLVVLDDVPMSRTNNPLDWTPFNGDKAKLQNTVATWLNLPWGGPSLVVMPGFHSPAENGLKMARTATQKIEPNGDDLFFNSLVLEACGAKTVLMSRWKTGGRASYDLVGEFLKNYQTLPAAEAWRQALLTVGGNPLDLSQEPRVKANPGDPVPTAANPFFWGAFILIDRGEKPAAVEPGNKLQ